MGLMVDAHTWWRMGDKSYTHEMIHELAQVHGNNFNPYWLEEPFPPEDHLAYKKLKEKGYVTVLLASMNKSTKDLRTLHECNATDFLQMDVCCQGGFDMGLKVFDLAADHNMKFAFHSWGTTLEVLAAAQLGVCRDESVVEWLEYPCYSLRAKLECIRFLLSDEILEGAS